MIETRRRHHDDRAKKKDLLCVRDNYVLIEMSYLSAPNNLYEVIYELKVNGYFPIMAHPERYYFLHNNFKEYQKLKKFGCFFQINLLFYIRPKFINFFFRFT